MDVNSLFNVKDKIVLVTGGGRGVGEMVSHKSSDTRPLLTSEISAAYVANGAKVYISSRDAKACEETAKQLTQAGPGKCIALPGDLSKYDECIRLAKEIEAREGSESSRREQLSSLLTPSPSRPGEQLWCNLGSPIGGVSRQRLHQALHA